ncbi:hypothetical protein ALC57_08053 [Trachymyrmex cornetzi]|uniref:Uncharacterized protein n=1 Tax=Trachymyrmex cornetzi TaxID=471704 RepID=A0A195E3S9_9HYME|nr:hypothetical protein ALC57_08053 [Trachymyrmex cornetzi]
MNSRARFKTLNARREDYERRQEKKEDETSKKKRTNSPAKSCARNVKIPRFPLKSPCGDRLGDLAGASFRRGFLAFKSLIGRDRARGPLKSRCRDAMFSRLPR